MYFPKIGRVHSRVGRKKREGRGDRVAISSFILKYIKQQQESILFNIWVTNLNTQICKGE